MALFPDLSAELISTAINGGIAVVVFIIWYYTFKYLIQQHEQTIKNYEQLVRETQKKYQELVKETKKDHQVVVDRFITVVEKVMEQNNYTNGLLIKMEGLLNRVLDTVSRKG